MPTAYEKTYGAVKFYETDGTPIFDTEDDLDLWTTMDDEPSPEPKWIRVNVPGADGAVDLSRALAGQTTYEMREIRLGFGGKCALPGFARLLPAFGFDACRPQNTRRPSGIFRIRIITSPHHFFHPGRNQRVATSAYTPRTGTRFKRDIHHRASSVATGFFQRGRFCMIGAASHMPPFADNVTGFHHHRPHRRIGTGVSLTQTSQRQGATHEIFRD